MNNQPAAPPDGGGGTGSAVLGAALNALRPTSNEPLSPKQLSIFLQQLINDGDGADAPVLGRTQRRTLVASAAERVGSEAFSRALIEALANFRIKKSLPGFLADLGPTGISNVETVRAIFARFGLTESSPPDEHAVAHLFAGLLAVSPDDLGRDNVTNWSLLVRAISTFRPVTWPRAIRALDDLEGFRPLANADWSGFAAALLASSYDAPSTPQAPAVTGLWGPWNQKILQLTILSGLLGLDADTFSFAAVPGRRVVTSADVQRASTTIRQSVAACERATWNSLDLVETLALLAADQQPDVKQGVTHLLERFIKEAPELLLIGLVQIPEPWNPIHMELSQKLMSMFLSSAPGHQLVFHISYQTNRTFVLQSLVRSYLNNPANVTRIVDVAQDLKALPALLEARADPAKPFFFALDVAALASRREILNADLFLERLIHEHGTTFMRATLDFLSEKLKEELALQEQDASQQQQQQFVAPSVQTVATFLRRLRTHGESMSAEDIEAFKMVRNLALQLHPRLLPIRASESQEPGMEVASFAQEIHEECDETFGRMYKQELSVEDVVAILQRLKNSERTQDTELFACMVHTLFDEQRYIKSYPPTELRLTAHLFGDLIQHSLIDYVALGIAIRGCLDALRTQPGSPMFEFGLEALKRFQGRLQDWPQLAQALQALPPHSEVTAILNRAAQAPVTAEAVATTDSNGANRPAFTAVDPGAEPFGSEEQVEPDEEASDKVLFAINNLSPSNLEGKLADVRPVLTARIFRWFAHYLTLERCQLEPNFHGLYLRFLQAVGDAKLDAYVLRETLALAQRLINSESTVSTLQSRKALQNIGSWLGLITLARDRPIRFKNIDFKLLLIEGYDSGRLIVAVPFVAKVLEQCSKSRVFKLPNPWLNAVLRVLAELYQLPELKLNLRFEIEVLCKSLGVDLKDIQPSSIIRSRELLPPPQAQQPHLALQQQQQAIEGAPPTSEMERLALGARDQRRPPPQQQPSEQAMQAAGAYTESLSQMLQNLPHYIQINPQLALFQNSAIKRLVYVAIDRAIREIVAPVVERSVTIASISTRELVTKDFAMEGDENKMRDAAHQMAANLAGSLALVTCKEPLRASMVGNARTLFLQSGFTEQTFPEPAVIGIMQDNLELACSVIEKAAMDKAMPEVDDGLANAYSSRREHRQRGRGFFWDAGALTTSQYAATLPEGLRLKHEGLQPQQLRVYQDFGNFARTPSMGGGEDERHAAAAAVAAAASAASGTGGPEAITDGAYEEGGALTAQQSLDKFNQCVVEIEQLLAQAGPDEGITTLPQGHELRDVVRQVPVIASQSMNRDEAALAFSQKVVQLLFKSETGLARDVYVILLERLCEVSIKVAKEVTAWLVYAEDERKFNVPVTVSLVRAGLMNIAETDVQLTKLIMRDFKPAMVDFAAKLALECLRDPPCATRGQLSNIIEALERAAQQGKATATATQFLEELDGLKGTKADVGNAALREQLSFCFAEWVRLFQHSPNAEKSFIDFVTQLQAQGILKGEEISSMFIRVCTEVGVDSYIKQKAAGGSLATGIFSPVDAFSKMVVLMIKYHSDPAGVNHDQAKVHYLTKILSIVVLVLAQSHEELGPHFQQKPFFRFFSTLLHDLHVAESSLQTTYQQSLLAISNTLNTLQPSFFPGFTFSWMSLISHRLFMPKLLANRQHGWAAFHRLFCSLLRFLGPILRKAELQDTSRSLYRGTLRIFLVLLHDFPDFLAAYHHSLCDLVPYTCTQMRNLVLSAFPRDRRLPDPFAPNLKIDRLPEVSSPPLVLSDYEGALPAELKSALALWGQSRSPSSFPASLKDVLLRSGSGDEQEMGDGSWEPRYDVPMVNALVLTSAINTLEKGGSNALTGSPENDATLALLRGLILTLDPEGIYLVLSACANQLRYPSSHSAYFSLAILHIFGHAETTDEVRGQVLRVLLERIVVTRPHPWALLMSVFELLRGNAQGRCQMPPGMPNEIEGLLDHIRGGLGGSAAIGVAGAGGDAVTSSPAPGHAQAQA
ncbi:Not1-domain-containing protein [Jaminaea rosea]|uniref:General negative regulator of transcription subunit 1 n=1 Tax=Jaminaea rosea TaxID=1569628 RepID=A0A316URT2_9BASI|nr:Not1-domain-containing protein [Jaminaea rosea]PWN28002.1 Not1-domain-containing protein [Jaminaea rosea]